MLATLVGFDNVVVGWNVEADLMALHIALPAIQVVDLARDPLMLQTFLPRLQQAGLVLSPAVTRLQLPKVIWALTNGECKIRKGKTSIRSLEVDAWMIAALWRRFGKAILKARQRAKSVNVPNAHAWMGTANTLEYVVSGTGGQLMKVGANLLGADKGPVKAGTDAFDRIMLQCNIVRVLPAYRLAGLAEEAFQNLCLSKMALVEAGLDALGEWPEINWDRPLRLRHTKQAGSLMSPVSLLTG